MFKRTTKKIFDIFFKRIFFRHFFYTIFVIITIWRWIIKKNISTIILAVGLCLVFTKALFSTYSNEQEMILDGNIYFLQY